MQRSEGQPLAGTWIGEFAGRCQVLAGRGCAPNASALLRELVETLRLIPPSASPLERVVIGSVITGVTAQILRRTSLGRSAEAQASFRTMVASNTDPRAHHRELRHLVEVATRLDGTSREPAGEAIESGTAATRALSAIGERFAERDLTLTDLAQQLGLSSWHVARMLRRETGRTFLEHLHQHRLTHARWLLTNGTLAIKQVAWQSGYASTLCLDRRFKRAFGVTPRQFRASATAAHLGPERIDATDRARRPAFGLTEASATDM